MSSHFDERSGIVECTTPWGRWYQTAEEVYVEIISSTPIRGKITMAAFTNKTIFKPCHF